MITGIESNQSIIIGIIIPILVAIIGLFTVKAIKNIYKIKGNRNLILKTGENATNEHSFNSPVQNAGHTATQVIGDHNQVNTFDINSVQILAQTYHKMMFPHAERALEKLATNSLNFLGCLNAELKQLLPEELDKFSEADVQIALQNAIKSASKRDSIELHQVLAKLIADRVQKPKQTIAELAINESIDVVGKLDINLIKILSLSFILSRTKYTLVLNEETLISKLSVILNEFNNMNASSPKFEYLEGVSCGKIVQIVSNDLINIISMNYPHLFIKKIAVQDVVDLALPQSIQNACFLEQEAESYRINPIVGLYLFENQSISVNGAIFNNDDKPLKDKLKSVYNRNRLSGEEIKSLIIHQIPEFDNFIKIWNENGFSQFSLTAIGIAIGRAYLEQKNFGTFDINTWIY